jgi:replicative DNA helicase
MWGQDAPPSSSAPGDLDAERILAATVMARPALVDDLAAEASTPPTSATTACAGSGTPSTTIRPSLTSGEIRWQAVDRQLQAWHADRIPAVPLNALSWPSCTTRRPPGPPPTTPTDHRVAVAPGLLALGPTCASAATSAGVRPGRDVAASSRPPSTISSARPPSPPSLLGDLWRRPGARHHPAHRRGPDPHRLHGPRQPAVRRLGARPARRRRRPARHGQDHLGLGFARAAAITNKIPTLLRVAGDGRGRTRQQHPVPPRPDRPAPHEAGHRRRHRPGAGRPLKLPRHGRGAAVHQRQRAPVPAEPARRVRHLVRTIGLRLVVIDYLQLMQAPKAENRQVAVSKLSRGLKLLAKEFGITLVVLAQLNRGPEQRTEKKPMVSDLRESGAIEQDADIVILLHREDAYEKESPRAGEADFIVGKHRGARPRRSPLRSPGTMPSSSTWPWREHRPGAGGHRRPPCRRRPPRLGAVTHRPSRARRTQAPRPGAGDTSGPARRLAHRNPQPRACPADRSRRRGQGARRIPRLVPRRATRLQHRLPLPRLHDKPRRLTCRATTTAVAP